MNQEVALAIKIMLYPVADEAFLLVLTGQ